MVHVCESNFFKFFYIYIFYIPNIFRYGTERRRTAVKSYLARERKTEIKLSIKTADKAQQRYNEARKTKLPKHRPE